MSNGQEVSSENKNIALADSNQTAWEIAQKSPPRSLEAIWKQVEDELRFAPECAEKSWYSIPYTDKKTGRKIPVEGVGIHGSSILVRAWGHCASGGFIREDSGDKVICRGMFFDHKSNSQFAKEVIVNRYQISSNGKPYRLVGKHWDNAVQSGVSKAQRNASLQGVPEFLKDRFFSLAKKLTLADKGNEKLTTQQKINLAKSHFKKDFKISEELFSEYTANLSNVETPEALLIHLKGLYSGLKSGETTVQEVFGVTPEGNPVMEKPREKEVGN